CVSIFSSTGKTFDITYIRLKFYTSRPESFAIFKRTRPGGDWIPYQYYSATCRSTYNVEDSTYVTNKDETRALCTSEFSDISPLTGGNVAFSTLEGRPSAYTFENSPLLQEWVTATDILITLDRVNTFGDEIFRDHHVLKSYYYAVSDFAVGGRCKCNGHASQCDYNGNHLVCRCEHNTAGIDCEICLPFYNDQPWARATSTDTHECKACNCNGRSDRCYFDPELWHQTGHGGHCMECRDNTDGANCERCKENFYQREDGRCVPCNCDPVGSRSLQCNNRGQCQCKPGIDGARCNKCAANFYDFSEAGCRPCGCNVAGSIDNSPNCDHITGVCRCKDNVEGQRCNQCKPGFFNLQAVNEFGCLPCFCFGHSSICRSAPGYSALSIDSMFTRDKDKWQAVDYNAREIPSKFNPSSQNIEVSAISRDPVYFIAPARYLGDQRASYNQFLNFTLRIGEEGPQATLEDVVLEGAGLAVSLPVFGQGNPLPSTFNQEFGFRLHEHSAYGWNPRLTAHDFMSILSDVTALKIKVTYTPEGSGYLDNVRLGSAQRSPIGVEATWVEMCTCPDGYVGQFCESCGPGYRHDPPGGGKFARCVPCNCNGHAEYCDPETGRCICQHNTAGDNCEHCTSGFYGNALTGTEDDCKPCPCPGNGACVVLPDEEVACLECPEGYAGHRCDLCVDGFYGEPQGQCRKCECNENVDPNAIGNCDRSTGECLKCIYNTGGRHCESCLPGFYGNALALPKGDCKACNCNPVGTQKKDLDLDILVCNYATGQCPCKQNVDGKHCDLCIEGYWNIASGEGCESCNCDPVGSLDHSCDIFSGQCKCRPGVTGQKCDQCQPYYYGFSIDGCKECDCDPIGSTSPQCDAIGQCSCRPNVEGRRCERCKENTYDKSAGCRDCPPCYNLVQDAANVHRSKLAELAELLQALRDNPQLLNDEEFVLKLRDVEAKVDKLLEDALGATNLDGKVGNKLRELRKRLEEIHKTSGTIARKMDDTRHIGGFGERNITIAEDIIKRAIEAMNNARKFLETEGLSALEKAIDRSKIFGQQSERMSEIAREARQLADEHEEQAEEIEKLALEALNVSKEAYEKARHALETPGETADKLARLERKLLEVDNMLEHVKKLAEDAKEEAIKAYDSALDLYTEANSVNVPDVDTEQMKQTAADIIEEAKGIQERAAEIMDKHHDLLDRIEKQSEDAQDLLKAGEKQQQMTDEMLANVDVALSKARDAVAAGEKTLEDAKQTLATLKGFDELIKESKGKADEALTKIPDIKQIIIDAEDKTRSAEEALSGAKLDAIESRDEAQRAEETAEEASRHANETLEGAEEAKNQANALRDQADELAVDVAKTAGVLREYENQAASDEALAKDALEQANQAKISATDASVKVKNALDTVEDILRALDGLDEIDENLLDELEKRLEAAEKEHEEANFNARLGELRQSRDIQHQWMKDYTEEVEKMMKDVANIAEIRNALPDKCYRRVVLEP
ncbi:laminin subunit gamma-1-like, partial [Uloborus diversus]|uniref:laminin subunit gamma-1-like n=1 Tax=Uloborus diversus TaxID=327109 RepID=UPI00240A1A24